MTRSNFGSAGRFSAARRRAGLAGACLTDDFLATGFRAVFLFADFLGATGNEGT
jgi:hypothetical protein